MSNQENCNPTPAPGAKQSSRREGIGTAEPANDVIVLYEYEAEPEEEYDLAMDGILLNGCSQYLFKFSIVVLPIIFILVIVIGLFERDRDLSEIRCRIGQIFIVIGVSVGLLALYFLCRYGFHADHARNLSRESQRAGQPDSASGDIGIDPDHNYKRYAPSKKQLKFILQNPWQRLNYSEPKKQYHNKVELYLENGLYSSNTISC